MPNVRSLAKWPLITGAIVLVGFVSYWATRPLLAPSWMGFAPFDTTLGAPKQKALWDWLNLLFIPGSIAGGVACINWATKKKDREIEEGRQCEAALDAY